MSTRATKKVYVLYFFPGEKNENYVTCEKCGRGKSVDLSHYKKISQYVKLKCPCGAVYDAKIEKRKYYRKASRSFSYRVAVPGRIDETAEPEVKSRNGLLTVTFSKLAAVEPKKLKIKTE